MSKISEFFAAGAAVSFIVIWALSILAGLGITGLILYILYKFACSM